MTVLISGKKRLTGVSREKIRKTAEAVLRLLQSSDAELSILLVDDAEMTAINSEYRGKNRPTDVIAFAMGEGEFGNINSNMLGDVVISLDRAKKQAMERNAQVMEEVRSLLIHGMLHLHGYDHEKDEAQRLLMEGKEKELLKALEKRNL
ncbi:MAG: rRNA maturation RNase YbeY [Deltaproteobacteria bacterium]|nr:rRNA maturation RNase YbeY [Deltaproteobacteria bacterium]